MSDAAHCNEQISQAASQAGSPMTIILGTSISNVPYMF